MSVKEIWQILMLLDFKTDNDDFERKQPNLNIITYEIIFQISFPSILHKRLIFFSLLQEISEYSAECGLGSRRMAMGSRQSQWLLMTLTIMVWSTSAIKADHRCLSLTECFLTQALKLRYSTLNQSYQFHLLKMILHSYHFAFADTYRKYICNVMLRHCNKYQIH